MNMKKTFVCLVALMATAFVALTLVACGPKAVTVTVVDGNDRTEVTAQEGMTIGEVLAEAAITVSAGDEVTPSLGTAVEAENMTVTIVRATKVTIAADGKTVEVAVAGGTVKDALEAAGVTLGEGDEVTPGLSTKIEGETMTVAVQRSSKVKIEADGKTVEVAIAGGTVADALKKAGITLEDGDVVTPSLNTKLTGDGQTIVVKRMYTVTVVADDEEIEVQVLAGTVAEALDEAKVELADGDTVDAELADPLTDGMVITVTRAVVEEPESDPGEAGGLTVVSRVDVPNCNGDGHGYFEVTWSDGSMTYEEY